MDEMLQLTLPTQPHKPFVKRHSRWFAFFGTTFLLGTFAVNEVKKEKAKLLSESVERAQNAFYERSYYEDLRENLGRIRAEIEQIGEEKPKPINLNLEYEVFSSGRSDKVLQQLDIKASPKNRHVTMEQFERLLTEQSEIKHIEDSYSAYNTAVFRFTVSVDLNKRLPYNRTLDDEHWKIERSLKLWHQVLRDVGSMKWSIDAAERESAAALFRRDSEYPRKYGNTTPLELIKSFDETVIERADGLRDDADRQAKFWKMCSLVLYPLGVILSFIGKLYDEDIPGIG